MGGAVVKVAKTHFRKRFQRQQELIANVPANENASAENSENVPPPAPSSQSVARPPRSIRPPLHPLSLVNANNAPRQERKVTKPLSINTNITPQKIISRENFLNMGYGSIGCTPQGEEKNQYKFYCPLCMYHFKGTIFVTSCCGNHTCFSCAVSYLAGKENYPDDLQYVPKRINHKIHCPHCGTAPFKLTMLKTGRTVRSYDNSPNTTRRLELLKVTQGEEDNVSSNLVSKLTGSFEFNVQEVPDWDPNAGPEQENTPPAQENTPQTIGEVTTEEETNTVESSAVERTTTEEPVVETKVETAMGPEEALLSITQQVEDVMNSMQVTIQQQQEAEQALINATPREDTPLIIHEPQLIAA